MPELLLELGCEELPASAVARAASDLQTLVEERLGAARIDFRRAFEPLCTPRRLIVSLADVAPRQPDQEKQLRGPSSGAAFGPEGSPTPALLGFCKGQGVDPSDVRIEGDYVWATKRIAGLPTEELLSELIPSAIRAMTFDKAMRWGVSRMRFVRPIRWIVAIFDGRPVSFEIEGVVSGAESRGDRFGGHGPFVVSSLDELVSGLRDRGVEPDPTVRRRTIEQGARSVAHGEPILSDALVDENVFLTEWPTALEGTFRPEYLALPRAVLETAMAKHERFFPVQGPDGALTNRFVSIRNGGEEHVVRQGNEWVLNARFNDAKFFFDEDARHTMAELLEKTRGVVFQEKLGTVRDRADRLAELAALVASAVELDAADLEHARLAGLFAKADLSSGLVSELPALQGLIGGAYAAREGMPEPVCRAISSHYSLAGIGDGDGVAYSVLIADQLDRLAGYLGLGLAPSGSSDPFGLRRAAGVLIEAAWSWKSASATNLDYASLLEKALGCYQRAGHALDRTATLLMLEDVFLSRYAAMMPGSGHDVVEAATQQDVLNPRLIRLKAAAIAELAENTSFVFAATRPINIVAAAEGKGITVLDAEPLGALDSSEGDALAAAVDVAQAKAAEARVAEDPKALASALLPLEQPINAFFDSTMVMVDDDAVRAARLGLLKRVTKTLFAAGDFSKLVIEG